MRCSSLNRNQCSSPNTCGNCLDFHIANESAANDAYQFAINELIPQDMSWSMFMQTPSTGMCYKSEIQIVFFVIYSFDPTFFFPHFFWGGLIIFFFKKILQLCVCGRG